jgi:molybdopterin-synthase adenylyltransferase
LPRLAGRCLECLGQFDSAQVPFERDGSLDDRRYIEALPDDHPLKARQNVFAFSQGAASLALEQFLRMVVAPGAVSDVGGQLHEFKPGTTTLEPGGCRQECVYTGAVATGESTVATFQPTGSHPAAEESRQARMSGRTLSVRLGRRLDDALESVRRLL